MCGVGLPENLLPGGLRRSLHICLLAQPPWRAETGHSPGGFGLILDFLVTVGAPSAWGPS